LGAVRSQLIHPARLRLTAVDDDAIRSLLTRLARAHPSGGTVIERAAILAEGADFDAIMAWIVARGGEPEATVSKPSPRVARLARQRGLGTADATALRTAARRAALTAPASIGGDRR
jgi:hypothetical protein